MKNPFIVCFNHVALLMDVKLPQNASTVRVKGTVVSVIVPASRATGLGSNPEKVPVQGLIWSQNLYQHMKGF